MDDLQFFGILIALGEDGLIEHDDVGFLGKLALDIAESVVEGVVGHKEDDTEGKHIAAFVGSLLVGTLRLADAEGERRNGGFDNGVVALHFVVEGIAGDVGLLEGGIGESVDVDNHGGTFLGPFEVGLERGGIHGDKDVAFVARTIDAVAHMDLIAANAGDGIVGARISGG